MLKGIKNIISKFFNLVAGSHHEFRLEHRLFNLMMILVLIIAILGAYYNYILGFPPITIYPSLLGGIIGAVFYYYARVKAIYRNYYVFVLAMLTMLIISIVFFYNSGSAGPIILLQVCLFIIYILISNGRSQFILLGMLLLQVAVLYYLEFSNPQWLNYYSNTKERFWDVLITFGYSTIFLTMAIVLFKKNYNRERNRIENQNIELAQLNLTVTEQNEKLEVKTNSLEKSLLEIQEKNEFINTMMRELNHRVKNNLQLVTSLLNIQETQSHNPDAKSGINLARNRIVSIGLIHQKLYRENLDLVIELSDYISELSEYLIGASAISDPIKLNLELETIRVDVETAVHIGLVVNELITNSIKHAWESESNSKKMSIKATYSNHHETLSLIVKDNGKGFSESFESTENSNGLDLIKSIIGQYNGRMDITTRNGAEIKLELIIKQI